MAGVPTEVVRLERGGLGDISGADPTGPGDQFDAGARGQEVSGRRLR